MSAHISRIGQAPISLSSVKDWLQHFDAMLRARLAAARAHAEIENLRQTMSPEILADIGLTPAQARSDLSSLGRALCVAHCAPPQERS